MPIYFDDESIYLKHIWTPVVRGYSAIKDGILANYTSYLRLEDAYAEDATEQIIRVGRDIPPYEYVDTIEMGLERRHRQYEGTNKNIESMDFSKWVVQSGSPVGEVQKITFNSAADEMRINTDSFGFTLDDFTKNKTFVITTEYVDYDYCFQVEGIDVCVSFSAQSDDITSIQLLSFPRASGVLLLAFQQPDAFSGSILNIRNINATAMAYPLPAIVTTGTSVTVNKGLITVPIEAIDTASFKGDGVNCVLANSIPSISKSLPFSVCFSINLTDYSTAQNPFTNINGASDGFGAYIHTDRNLRVGIYNGSSYFTKASGDLPAGDAKAVITYDGISVSKLYIDAVLQVGVTQPAIDLTEHKLSILARTNCLLPMLSGNNLWDIPIYDRALSVSEVAEYQSNQTPVNPVHHYKLSEYREDDYVKDSAGANPGTATATVNLLLIENQGFGYPVNQEERKPFDATTDDDVDFKYGAKGVLQGIAKGEENSVNYNFDLLTGWAVTDGWTYGVGEAICDGTQIGTTRITQLFDFEDGSRYEMCAKPNSFDAGFLRFSTGGRAFDWNDATGGTGIMSVRFNAVASDTNIRLEGNVGAIANIDFFSCRKVSPAVGHINFEEYMFAGFPAVGNIDLITKEDGTPFLYIDSTDGLLKGFDGVNTCVSNTAMVPFIYYSFFLYLNGSQFWVTLDTDKGTEVAFTGSINDLGNRLRIMPTGTYQTVEDIIIGDSLNFYYIVQNDIYIVQNGTTITQYS